MENRIEKLDILRGLAILGVIFIHLTSDRLNNFNFSEFSSYFFLLFNQLSRFCVPIFIILSGIGLTLSYNRKPESYFKFLHKRLSKIIPLYLIFCIIYYCINLFKQHSGFDIISLIKCIFTGNASMHLYFVPLIIQLYLLFPLINKFKSKKLVIISMLANILIIVVKAFARYKHYDSILLEPLMSFYWIFYFIFGCYITDKLDKIKLKNINIIFYSMFLAIFIESILLFTRFNMTISTSSIRPSIIFFSIAVFAYVFNLNISNTVTKILKYLSNASFMIYLSHMIFLGLYWEIFKQNYNILNLFGNLAFTLMCSCLLYEIYTKIQFKNIVNKEQTLYAK